MSKHFIIDWQPDSILAATCSGRGGRLHIDRLSYHKVDDTDAAALTLPEAVKAAVAELRVPSKSTITVVASRENVEVRTIGVPRMDADDLPDVIRFQAQRQLASMSDSWTLDYIMLPDVPGQEMQTALVGAIAPEKLSAIESACEAASLQLAHLALRPIEIARHAKLLKGLPTNEPGLVVCLSNTQADQLLANNGQVVQVRNTRLPTETEAMPAALAGDIRRSMLAAASLTGNRPIAETLLIAQPAMCELAQPAIAEATNSPVSLINASEFTSDIDDIPAEATTNRLAAILGASQINPGDKKSSLDFKNPKRRPPKKSKLSLYILAGLAAVLLLCAGISWWVQKNRSLDEKLAQLEDEIESKKPMVKSAGEKLKELAQVKQFLDASPNFLDELKYASDKMPESEKVLLTGLTFSILADGSGLMQTTVRANKAESISEFETSLRDENHVVQGRGNQLTDSKDGYKWSTTEDITIKNRGWKLIDAPVPSKKDSSEEKVVGETETGTEDTLDSQNPKSDSGEEVTEPSSDPDSPAQQDTTSSTPEAEKELDAETETDPKQTKPSNQITEDESKQTELDRVAGP